MLKASDIYKNKNSYFCFDIFGWYKLHILQQEQTIVRQICRRK